MTHLLLAMLCEDMPEIPEEATEHIGVPTARSCSRCAKAVWVAPKPLRLVDIGTLEPICIPCANDAGHFDEGAQSLVAFADLDS